MPYTPQQVYRSENLRFATQEGTRQPTMYFRTDHGSGRLRQEHDSGPKVQDIRKHTTHAFFKTKDQQVAFHRDLRAQGTGLTRTQYRELRAHHGGHHTPREGYFHHEASFQGHGGGSLVHTNSRGDAARLHKNGGQVVSSQKLETLRGQTSTIARRMGV
ncbi:hypothetical protein KIH87_18835 [Paraneptunicella aestuarii]|uniref:hypothetical protein n=1 Tax=Paraneptunicella aestuarii TaxID=2831148 RepID=UPI001E3453C4|nr:hypothetical protein [Paraneptunicella aestuarii]UAA38690.1 hypothetical protein KIH87_18835 [Paraneptunicella aestuarii]